MGVGVGEAPDFLCLSLSLSLRTTFFALRLSFRLSFCLSGEDQIREMAFSRLARALGLHLHFQALRSQTGVKLRSQTVVVV